MELLTIDAVELRRVRLELVAPFRTSFGTQSERDALLVRVRAGATEGWGECVSMAEPSYSSEWVDGSHEVMRRFLVPALEGAICAIDVAGRLAGVKGHRMAKAALEAAVLDAELRASGLSLAEHLGGSADRVLVGVSVGITPTLEGLIETVGRHLEEGYARIKVKIEPGWELEPCRVLRAAFGDSFGLQVDANSAFDPADRAHEAILDGLDDLGLLLIEQPYDEEELVAHARLAERLRTPVCLDESITSERVAAQAIELRAADVVNIKAGRVGGYLEAARIHDRCRAAGIPVWCGGMLETGIGRAANLALAALPGFTLPGDISASDRYWRRDITAEPFRLGADGTIAVPTGPGIGVEVDHDFLDSVTTSIEVLVP